jgi:hypothetical protein
MATNMQLSSGHSHSRGIRSALFYAGVMGAGHWLLLRTRAWYKQRVVDAKLRKLYSENDTLLLKQIAQQDIIPDRKQVVSLSWTQLITNPILMFHEYGWQLPNWLPLLHSEQDYQYRKRLEERSAELHQQVAALENLRNIRRKELKSLKEQVKRLQEAREDQISLLTE